MTIRMGVNHLEYSIDGGEPVIHVFGRDIDGHLQQVNVRGFRPYFYVEADDRETIQGIRGDVDEIDFVTRYASYRGKDLRRVYVTDPRSARNIYEAYRNTYEIDVAYVSRFMIDCGITSGIEVPDTDVDVAEVVPIDIATPIRVGIIDIECISSDDRFPVPEKDPIMCVTCWDSFTDHYTTFYMNHPDFPPVKVSPSMALPNGCFNPARHTVHIYDDEVALLRGLAAYVQETDPDVLTGWNFTGFDMPYTATRMAVLNMQPMALYRIPGWGGKKNDRAPGRAVFDLLEGYKKLQSSKKPSYRLDAIGEEELGDKKVRYIGTLRELWANDPLKMIEYNVKDVELCVGINRKNTIIDFYRAITNYVGCMLGQTLNSSQVIDMYVLRMGHGKMVFPSRPRTAASREFEGAVVLEPSSGLREDVIVLDLKSLYPMSMMTLNASPETKDPAGEIKSPIGVRYRKSPDGITRTLIANLLKERDRLKAERNKHPFGSDAYNLFDMQQAVVKVIMNTYYGVSGFATFRLYDPDIGASVTSTGRAILEHCRQVVTDLGYNVVYGDSVAGDSKIEIVQGGRRDVVCIQDLFTQVDAVKDDGREYCNLYDVSTETIDGYGKLCVRSVPYVMRHKVSKKMYRVRLTNEWYIDVTEDHSLFGYLSKIYRSKNLKSYERIVEVKPSELGDKVRSLIVRKKSVVDGISTYDSDDLYRLFGYFMGNGSFNCRKETGKNYYCHVSCGGDVNDIVDRILVPLQKQGYVRNYWVKPNGDIAFNGNVVAIINDNLRDADGNKKIPEFLATDTVEHIAAFVSGWFSADGTVLSRRNGGGCTVRVSNINKAWIDELQRLMYRLSIATSVFKGNTVNTYDGVCSGTYNYYLVVSNLAVFKNVVGFVQDRKQSKISTCGRRRDTFSDIDVYRNSVMSVEEIDYDGYVYDIEVTGTHRFFANNVLVHNTDSCMVELNCGGNFDEVMRIGHDIEKTLNASFDQFARDTLLVEKHWFSIKFEKYYRRFFQSGKKKRYAGDLIWKEGVMVTDPKDRLSVTGFEMKRSDSPQITREVQERLLTMIVQGEDAKKIKQYVRGVVGRYRRREYPLEQMGIPGGIQKELDAYENDDAHLRGARYSNDYLRTNFGSGSKPMRVYIANVTGLYPRTDVICFEYADQVPKEFVIDMGVMLEKTLKKPIMRLVTDLGWSWEELDPSYTTLDMYGT